MVSAHLSSVACQTKPRSGIYYNSTALMQRAVQRHHRRSDIVASSRSRTLPLSCWRALRVGHGLDWIG